MVNSPVLNCPSGISGRTFQVSRIFTKKCGAILREELAQGIGGSLHRVPDAVAIDAAGGLSPMPRPPSGGWAPAADGSQTRVFDYLMEHMER